jgi:hypothetical protein
VLSLIYISSTRNDSLGKAAEHQTKLSTDEAIDQEVGDDALFNKAALDAHLFPRTATETGK